MNAKSLAVIFAVFACPSAVLAEDLTQPDNGSLHCRIASCSPAADCQAPITINGKPFAVAAGSEFMFQLNSDWKTSPSHYRLADQRYVGESYLVRTTVNIDIDRSDKSLKLDVAYAGSGTPSRTIAAIGSCEAMVIVPMTF